MNRTIDIIREIHVRHPRGPEFTATIRDWCRHSGDGDRAYCEMEIARALHWIGALWHGGQWDVLYLAQCGEYTPGPCEGEPGCDDDDRCAGDDLYQDLAALCEGKG